MVGTPYYLTTSYRTTCSPSQFSMRHFAFLPQYFIFIRCSYGGPAVWRRSNFTAPRLAYFSRWWRTPGVCMCSYSLLQSDVHWTSILPYNAVRSHYTYPISHNDGGSHSMLACRGGRINRSVITQYQCETPPLISRPSSLWLKGAQFIVIEYLQSSLALNGPCPWGVNLARTLSQGRRRLY